MMYGQPEPCVVIAGTGVAGAALAGLLRDHGFGVVLLARRHLGTGAGPGTSPVIEALPEATVRLFAEVGLAGALEAAGAVAVAGFDNAYNARAVRRLDGRWVHVDRTRLARMCLTVARRRGATVLPTTGLAVPLQCGDPNEDEVTIGVGAGPARLRAFAAVDATGRAARWSRPVSRAEVNAGISVLYRGPGSARARPGRVIRTEDGWAYRLDHPEAATVGVITRSRPAPARTRPHPGLDPEVAARLGITDPRGYLRVATRPAAVQWSRNPVAPTRLAVGDAALAYSPLAGQGLRFALASALAAAAVLTSWRERERAPDRTLATRYYQSFVTEARARHLAHLTALDTDPPTDPVASETLHPGRRLRFVARTETAGVNTQGRIVADTAVVLPDGGLARWVSGFDLLRLRDAVAGDPTVTEAGAALTAAGLPPRTAAALLTWALHSGVIADAPTADMAERRK